MVDFRLSEEQSLLQKTARDFAKNEIKPIVKEIIEMERAGTKFKPWDLCQKMYRKGAKLGFTTLLIPEKYGGGGMGCMDNVVLLEELGAGDVGIAAAYFNMSITPPKIIVVLGTEEQREKWLKELCSADPHPLASAGSEPDTAGSNGFCLSPDPSLGIKTYARREGDGYVINGTKSGFITNAGVAKNYFVMARTDLKKPHFESTSLFYVPAAVDLPGFTVGKRTELMGWRTAQCAEVFFDDVRIPKETLLGQEGGMSPSLTSEALPYIGIGLAACYVGLARSTYEYALKYAQERVSWGQPIIRHQAVALMLADMIVDTQLARLAVWDAAYATDTRSELLTIITKEFSSKCFAIDVAIKNAENAVKVLGSYGITREYQASKYLSDAWVGYPCHGTHQMLKIHMMNCMFGEFGPPPGTSGPPTRTQ